MTFKDSTERLLRKLNSRIVETTETTYRIEVAPGAIVDVPRPMLRSWCCRRLESRKSHKGYGIKYAAGKRLR